MSVGGSGVYISINAGESWISRSSGIENKDVKCLTINEKNTDDVYIGTNQGVFLSKDRCISWEAVNNGLTNLDVRALVIDPQNPKIIYAGTMGGGVFKMILE